MAYVTGNLNLITLGFLESNAGSKQWCYTTTDAPATYTAANYITDATKKGMVKGDIVFVVNTTTPAYVECQVSAITSGAATLIKVGTKAPDVAFNSISSGNGTMTAGQMEGAAYVILATSGATALTTMTAAQLIAASPGLSVGDAWIFRVFNTNGGTLTLTGGTGVTITGTATIATNVTRDYRVQITTATTITMQNLGAGNAT